MAMTKVIQDLVKEAVEQSNIWDGFSPKQVVDYIEDHYDCDRQSISRRVYAALQQGAGAGIFRIRHGWYALGAVASFTNLSDFREPSEIEYDDSGTETSASEASGCDLAGHGLSARAATERKCKTSRSRSRSGIREAFKKVGSGRQHSRQSAPHESPEGPQRQAPEGPETGAPEESGKSAEGRDDREPAGGRQGPAEGVREQDGQDDAE